MARDVDAAHNARRAPRASRCALLLLLLLLLLVLRAADAPRSMLLRLLLHIEVQVAVCRQQKPRGLRGGRGVRVRRRVHGRERRRVAAEARDVPWTVCRGAVTVTMSVRVVWKRGAAAVVVRRRKVAVVRRVVRVVAVEVTVVVTVGRRHVTMGRRRHRAPELDRAAKTAANSGLVTRILFALLLVLLLCRARARALVLASLLLLWLMLLLRVQRRLLVPLLCHHRVVRVVRTRERRGRGVDVVVEARAAEAAVVRAGCLEEVRPLVVVVDGKRRQLRLRKTMLGVHGATAEVSSGRAVEAGRRSERVRGSVRARGAAMLSGGRNTAHATIVLRDLRKHLEIINQWDKLMSFFLVVNAV